MVDTRLPIAPAIDQTDNTTIWFVGGTIADLAAPKAATEIGAATTYEITYDFTPDGFPFTGDQGTTTDERLASSAVLQALDKITYSFGNGIVYIDTGAVAGHAAVVLATTTSLSGYFVVRKNIPRSTLAAASQKVITIPVTLGVQVENDFSGVGKPKFKQAVTVTSPPVRGTLAA